MGGTNCCKDRITRKRLSRQKARAVCSRAWSSAVNQLKGRENEIQVPDEKEEEEHVLSVPAQGQAQIITLLL